MTRSGACLLAIGLALAPGLGALAADTNAGAASTTGDAQRGEQLFDSHGCGFCHENGGRSAGKGPKLAGTTRSDSFIIFRIEHGKEGAMPAWASVFNTAQLADLLAYIRSLKD
jgi:mono/diheme cytochrome c family protein